MADCTSLRYTVRRITIIGSNSFSQTSAGKHTHRENKCRGVSYEIVLKQPQSATMWRELSNKLNDHSNLVYIKNVLENEQNTSYKLSFKHCINLDKTFEWLNQPILIFSWRVTKTRVISHSDQTINYMSINTICLSNQHKITISDRSCNIEDWSKCS